MARHTSSRTCESVSPARVVLLAALLAVSAPLAAVAAEPERPARYTMSPTDGGFMRLDTETGAMSLCTRAGGQWTCSPVAETDAAERAATARLRTENAELKATVRHLEEMLGVAGGRSAGTQQTEKPPSLKLPTEKEVDEALDYVDRMFRKFRDRLRQLEGSDRGTPL